jgi:hypothetical protein
MATKHQGTNSTGEENKDETDTRKVARKFKAPKMVKSKAVEKTKEISEEVEIISTMKRARKLSYKAQEMAFKSVKLEKIKENIASQRDKNRSASQKEINNKGKNMKVC